MKKNLLLCMLAIGMIACTEKNSPDNPGSGNGNDKDSTSAVTPSDTTIVTTDTIRITWNGQKELQSPPKAVTSLLVPPLRTSHIS